MFRALISENKANYLLKSIEDEKTHTSMLNRCFWLQIENIGLLIYYLRNEISKNKNNDLFTYLLFIYVFLCLNSFRILTLAEAWVLN